MVYYSCSIIKEIIMTQNNESTINPTDVFVLVTPDHDSDEQGAVKDVQGVVLPSKKVLGGAKDYLQMHVDDAQKYWEEDGNSGDIPIDRLYRYLVRMTMSAYSPGWLMSADDARQLIKRSGGL